MAVGIHVAHTAFLPVKANGQLVSKDDPATTINDVLKTEHKHVILPDATNAPNSVAPTTYPTVDVYLQREAASGYILNHIDQTTIITYSAHDINVA